MKQEPFVIERTLNATAEKIWRAITDKDQMKKWYFDLSEFKPEVGFEFTFEAGSRDKTYIHTCKIIEVEPNRKLKHSWAYNGYQGYSIVTWELFPEGDSTLVKLTHEGLETFLANDDPNFATESFAKGWTHIIGTSLKGYIEKNK